MLEAILVRVAGELDPNQVLRKELDELDPLVERIGPLLEAAATTGCLTRAELEDGLAHYRVIRPDSFAYCDIATDLMRRAALCSGDDALATRATEEHCQVLLGCAEMLFDRANGDMKHQLATSSLMLAIRARRVLNSSKTLRLNPELIIGAELATGRVYAYPGSIALYLAIPPYLRAARMMKQQGFASRYDLMMHRLRSMANYIVETTVNGAEYSLISIDEAASVAEEAGDTELSERINLTRVNAYRRANLFDDAVALSRRALASPSLSPSIRDEMLLELASSLGARQGGTHSPRQDRREISEAVEILENLLGTNSHAVAGPESRRIAQLNLATLHAIAGDRERASAEYAACHELFAGQKDPFNETLLLIQWSSCLIQLRRGDEARQRLAQAERIVDEMSPPSFRHFGLFASLASQRYELGELDAARARAEVAQELYEQELDRLVDPKLWRGIYAGFHRIDSYIVEANLKTFRGKSDSRSLRCVEAPKARTLVRLRALINRHAVLLRRTDRDQMLTERIERALAWSRADPKRALVSAFVGHRGLGIVALRAGESSAAWIDDFRDHELYTDVLAPLAELVARGFNGDPLGLSAASALADAALARIGEAIWRCIPALAEGGSELLLLPHRLLRGLPMSHALLPGGKRLSELFDSVTVLPSLCLPSAPKGEHDGETAGAADSRGDLLLARFEVLRACRRGRCLTVSAATKEGIKSVLGSPGRVLIGCHGVFRPRQPWESVIVGHDNELSVFELCANQKDLTADLIYLSACESGMADVSLEDDPVGFSSLFALTGARAVVAPLWRVDDFSALLFSDAFFRELSTGASPSRSTMKAAVALRNLTAANALRTLASFRTELTELVAARQFESAEAESIATRFNQLETWLRGFYDQHRPFALTIEWGAFQCFANPFTESGDFHV